MPVKRSVKRTSKAIKINEPVMPQPVDTHSATNKFKQPKILITLAVVILAVLAVVFRGLFIAALVNGQPITRLAVIQDLEKQGGKQTLSSLVNQSLILQEAKKKNVTVSQKEIDDASKQVEDSLKSQGQNLDAALAMQGMTKQDFLTQLKLRSLVEKLLADKIKVTDAEVSGYIEKNKDTFPTDLKADEMKQRVVEQLKQQKLSTESQTWLANLQKNAKINYFVNY